MIPFRKSLTPEEQIKWENALKSVFEQPGYNYLSRYLHKLIGGNYSTPFDKIIDRTKTYDDMLIYSPIPPMAPSKSFEECMVEQAQHIKRSAAEHNLTPYLMWSGGLDSTGALYALINEGMHFNVLFEQQSCDEYPKVAQEILDHKFEGVTPIFSKPGDIIFPKHARENQNALYITGEMGDTVFGPDWPKSYFDYETRTLLADDYVDKFVPRCLYNATISSVSKIAPDPTLGELLWALSFIYKWHKVLTRVLILDLRGFGPDQNTIHFFDTPNFQLYAMNNYKESCNFVKDTECKMALRQYIFDQNGDQEYFDTKCKKNSMGESDMINFWHDGLKKEC